MFGTKEWLALLLLISVPIAISVITIVIDRLAPPIIKKEINIFYVNKIKYLYRRISFEKEAQILIPQRKNEIIIRGCERWVKHWLDKAGIINDSLRKELLDYCNNYSFDDDNCKELENLGWVVDREDLNKR